MRLSDTETHYVASLRRRSRLWRSLRWLSLGGNLVLAGLWTSLIARLLDMTDEQKTVDTALTLAWSVPLCLAFLFSAVAMLAHTIVYWRGDAKTALLLRVLDQRDEQEKPT